MSTHDRSDEPPFSRTKLLGIDVITFRDPAVIQSVSALPEVVRVAAAVDTPDDLPWLFRWFFPKTRFYNPRLRGWFLPFRATSDATYAPCRRFLDTSFAQQRDTAVHVARTVDLLTDPQHRPTDAQLAEDAIRAIWAYIVPRDHSPLPSVHLAAASDQIGDLSDSFLPWKLLRSVRTTAAVFDYVDSVLHRLGLRGLTPGNGHESNEPPVASTGPLPDPVVTDAAHPLFAMAKNAPDVLRRLAELRPGEDVTAVLCAVGPVRDVPRMVTQSTTLNGLLGDREPAEKGKTVLLFAVGEAAAATGDPTFVFSGGPGQRECAARGVVENYFEDVHAELIRRRQTAAAGAEDSARPSET